MNSLHPLVEEVLQTGRITFPDGEVVQAHSHIPRDECELLYRMVQSSRAARAVEIGMAFGISTLCLCDALQKHAKQNSTGLPQLVAIDPDQSRRDGWQNVGVRQVERAGFRDIVVLHERTSQEVLPELDRQGYRCQLAFIDGWHTFDHTLIDFFYADRILEVGGVVVFDDVGYPAINSVLRFVLSNRGYDVVEALRERRTAGRFLRFRRSAKRFLKRFVRTDKDPAPEHARLFQQIHLDEVHSIALRKRENDGRRFDHFCPF